MKFSSLCITIYCCAVAHLLAIEPPEILGQYLEPNKPTKGEVVQVSIPPEFLKFRELLNQAQKADPEWFKKLQENADKENPIPPYDAKLGMTKEEYDKYLEIWEQRTYKRVADGEISLMLTLEGKNDWVINVTGKGMPITLLTYITEKDQFKSSNGVLSRIADIKSPKESLYRDWSGQEWKYLNEGDLGKTKENLAIGRSGDGRYGMLIYSLQEVTRLGHANGDDLIMIRFIPKKLKE